MHRVDGYHIRAHYGHGNVDFTITKDTNKTRELKWIEIEREMFRKFHRARFYIEPIERPGASQLQLCSDTGTRTLKFSIRVRQISGRTAFEDHDHSTFQITIPKGKATETKDSISLGSSFTTKAPQSEA